MQRSTERGRLASPAVGSPAPPRRSVPVPRGWLTQYVVGGAVVIGLMIGGLIATYNAVGHLADAIRGASVATCAGAPATGCRAVYPATILEVQHGDSTRLVLRTSFLADTARTDECFGSDCRDAVQLRRSDGKELQLGQHVTINAGKGRIYTVSANGSTWRTYDNPGIAWLDAASSLTWTLYLDAFAISWLAAYLFLVLRFGVVRIAARTLRRHVTMLTVVAAIGSVLSFVVFAQDGPRWVVLLAAGLLIAAGAGLLVRRHPETRQPEFVAHNRWQSAYERALSDAFYVLCAFALSLGLAVAFLFAHDDGNMVAALISALIGIGVTAFIEYRLHRQLNKPA